MNLPFKDILMLFGKNVRGGKPINSRIPCSPYFKCRYMFSAFKGLKVLRKPLLLN